MVKRSSFFLLTIFLKDLKKNGCNLLICNRFPFENNYNKKRINFLLYQKHYIIFFYKSHLTCYF